METTTSNYAISNVSKVGRITRIAVGLALIYSTVFQAGTLGLAAVLPLLAIYPMTTGVLGWDPILQLGTTNRKRTIHRVKVGHAVNQA